jgi:hypothetical protein
MPLFFLGDLSLCIYLLLIYLQVSSFLLSLLTLCPFLYNAGVTIYLLMVVPVFEIHRVFLHTCPYYFSIATDCLQLRKQLLGKRCPYISVIFHERKIQCKEIQLFGADCSSI